MGDQRYVLDTSVVIDLHDHFHIRRVRKTLRGLCTQDRLVLPEGVKRELRRRTDRAYETVRRLAEKYPNCQVRLKDVPNLCAELARIEKAYGQKIQVGPRRYPGFWKSHSGHKAIDGQVVSIGKKLQCTVVADDQAVRLACLLENVPCIGWTEFARLVGLSAPTQRRLFQ